MLDKPKVSERSSDMKKAYDWTPCKGCFWNHSDLYRTRDGKKIKMVCKTYSCEKHGWIKKNELRDAIERRVLAWDKIRFFTFSLTNKYHQSPETHSKTLSEVWRYFVTELRRNKILNLREQNLQYIRVSEAHKSGFIHFHVFSSQYVHFTKLNTIWQHACEVVFLKQNLLTRQDLLGFKKLGNVNTVGNRNAKVVAGYVVKYVTKMVDQKIKYSNLYSSSGNEALFDKVQSDEAYAIHNRRSNTWRGLYDLMKNLDVVSKNSDVNGQPILVSNIELHHTNQRIIQENELFYQSKLERYICEQQTMK